ncbi:valine--tRNA ligase [Candidatus Aerophobetes bacterium]|nr:valine--tRNA ligase [Candidatus Aerophobetes bacterium]
MEMEKKYNPHPIEEKWESFWEEKDYFSPHPGKRKETFSMVMPPPNITGVLHMGHAFNITLQDIVVRFKRMQGYEVLWIPGIDHAGIATQNVVERKLQKEGFTREKFGREKFIERIWQWKEKYGERIFHQMRKFAISCSWEDKAFTMDESHSRAVREVFIALYEQGYIYRGDYIINWCPRCQTALSDIEVEYEDFPGKLYYIRYPFVNSKTEDKNYITVATTRPETILGDTAVAVNPEDERYKKWKGKKLVLPLVGRVLPLIFDEYVDPDFGTGALKVTPAHDTQDFLIGKRHNLALINIFNKDATINEKGGIYQGFERYRCRKKIVEDLKNEGCLEKMEDYTYRLGRCYRCETSIEPFLSTQWFIRMRELAEDAIGVVKEGKIKFYPECWERNYFDWLEKIHDWCISRQIWWGHRLPVWYCQDCGEIIVTRQEPTRCKKCSSSKIKQEEDVLDTWFSSSLWPFSTLGWPEAGEKFNRFYPTSLLCSGWDILFFWVARMVMMGIKFTHKVPFEKVHIHPLIGDEKGEKMSKSRGNVVDPIDMTKKYGTDAFRFSLVALKTETPYLRFSPDRVRGYRNFANKIWNVSRFVLMNIGDFSPSNLTRALSSNKLQLCDRWILSRCRKSVKDVTLHLETFEFSQAAQRIYQFIWQEFCDWYVELTKSRLRKEGGEDRYIAQAVLYQVLRESLKLLHPFMPFITEDIFQRLPGTKESIMISNWPEGEGGEDKEAEEKMSLLMEIIVEIRTIRAEMEIPPQKKIEVILRTKSPEHMRILKENSSYITDLVHAENLVIASDVERPKICASGIAGDIDVFVPLKKVVNIEKEKKRLYKIFEDIEKELERTEKKLTSGEFLQKAPAEVVEKEKEKKAQLILKRDKLKKRLKELTLSL